MNHLSNLCISWVFLWFFSGWKIQRKRNGGGKWPVSLAAMARGSTLTVDKNDEYTC